MTKSSKNVPENQNETPEVTELANMKRAKEVFATYHADKVFFTEDGTAFLQEQHARMHAENLKKPEIKTITRKETE